MSKISNPQEILIKYGMKELLIARLNSEAQELLASFAMEHSKDSNITNMLITLASMEMQGKVGAIYLAAHLLGTIIQLKGLSKTQVISLVSDHEFHQDHKLTIRNLKSMLIAGQQEKLFIKSQGLKGEYYIDPKELGEQEEEDSL